MFLSKIRRFWEGLLYLDFVRITIKEIYEIYLCALTICLCLACCYNLWGGDSEKANWMGHPVLHKAEILVKKF